MNNEQVAALIQQLLAANPNMSATDLQNAVMGAGATFNQFRTAMPITQAATNGSTPFGSVQNTPISQFVTGGGAASPTAPVSAQTTPISNFVAGGGTVPVGAPPNAIPPTPAATQPINAKGGLVFDTSKFDPIYGTDQNGDQFISGYAGKTKINGQDVIAYTDTQGNLSQAAQIAASQTQPSRINQYDSKGNIIGTSIYDPNPAGTGPLNALGFIGQTFAGAALSIAFPQLATTIGSALGASAALAPVVGGAALGGLTSAATGGNVLQGAALGGIGGYLQGAGSGPMGADYTVPYGPQPLGPEFNQYLSPTSGLSSSPFTTGGGNGVLPTNQYTGEQLGNSLNNINTGITQPLSGDYTMPPVDYSLTPNTNPNLPSMGGGQGLVPSTNPNLPSMGGGQGITMPTSANLPSMGGGQGITTNAAGGGTLGQTGVNTGATLLPTNPLTGQTLGTALNNINTGVQSPFVTGGGVSSTTSPGTTAATTAATAAGTAGGVLGTGLTAAQIAAIGSGLGSLVTGNNTSNAITAAQNIQNQAAGTSQSTLKDIYNQQLAFTKPYQDVGVQGANALSSNLPYFQHQFNVNDLNTNLAPNYQFQLGQGQMANQRAANVGGGALSGNTLTGLNRYTQDYAGNAYQQAFNNYDTQRKGIYNTLSGIAGIGNTANQQAIGAGNTYGTNTANLTTGLAAAQAGATMAQSQNQTNSLNNIINNAALLLSQNNTSPAQGFTTGP